jgi:oxygen-dependent protoporphyrinogen oxidase
MPQFPEMERNHGSVIRGLFARKKLGKKNTSRAASGPRYSLFLSYKGGMEQLTRTIASKLPEVRFKVSSAATKIKRPAGWEVVTQQGDTFGADAVCVALSAPQAAQLLAEPAPSLSRDLAAIPYESVATVNLAYRRADIPHLLGGFGFVVPAFTGRKIVACSFSSVKFAGRAPEGMVLLRAFVGGALHREIYALEDDAMVRTVTEELRHYLGVAASPVFISISRHPQSMPQYQVGHLGHVASIRSQLAAFPGLYLVGNAYNGIGVPDCVKGAELAAESMFAHVFSGQAQKTVAASENR